MGIIDFFIGGNTRVSAKSTVDIFNEGVSMYGDFDHAYRYTYIFRLSTIARYIKHERDEYVVTLFRRGDILNCTYITAANLNTGAAPKDIYFPQTYQDFHEGISENLRKFNMPEKYISGDNYDCVVHILKYLQENLYVPPNMYDRLVKNI